MSDARERAERVVSYGPRNAADNEYRLARDLLVALDRVNELERALREARKLAVAVADKNIGPLSDQARGVQGEINALLGDLPSYDEVQDIVARALLDGTGTPA